MKKPRAILTLIALALSHYCTAQTYTDDLDDISRAERPVSAIGNLGHLEKVIDIRGFVPFSFYSKSLTAKQNIITRRESNRWFKIPTRIGAQAIYYGVGDEKNTTKDTPIYRESEITEPDKKWALLAYELSNRQGQALFKAMGKSSGYEGCDPVLVLITKESAFVVINIRYSDWDSNGTGQYLVGLEFSRAFSAYKTFYLLYSDAMFTKSSLELFRVTEPVIGAGLKILTAQ